MTGSVSYYIITNIATAATPIIAVVNQPKMRWLRVATNLPICLDRDPTISVADKQCQFLRSEICCVTQIVNTQHSLL